MPPAKISHPPLRDFALLGARVLIAALFLVAAFNKLVGYAGVIGYFRKLGLPEPSMLAPSVIGFEILAGLLLLVGYQTRIVALLIAGFCIVSGVLGHSQISDPNNLNHLLKNFALAGGALALYAAGAGSRSLDGR
jgi:putative oxidoreductase